MEALRKISKTPQKVVTFRGVLDSYSPHTEADFGTRSIYNVTGLSF